MAETVVTLRSEHRKIRDMLRMFEAEISAYARNETPDYDRLEDSIAYCLAYLNLCHRPNEAALLDRLSACDQASARNVDESRIGYEDLARGTAEFGGALNALRHGSVFARETIVAEARALLDAYHRQIEREEIMLIRVAERCHEANEVPPVACRPEEAAVERAGESAASRSISKRVESFLRGSAEISDRVGRSSV